MRLKKTPEKWLEEAKQGILKLIEERKVVYVSQAKVLLEPIVRGKKFPYFHDIYVADGFCTLFEKWLWPARLKSIAKEIESEIGIPILATDVPPPELVRDLRKISELEVYSKRESQKA